MEEGSKEVFPTAIPKEEKEESMRKTPDAIRNSFFPKN